MAGTDLVVVSNRGPLSFALRGGVAVPVAPPGGLAASLRNVLVGTGAAWVFAATSEADHVAREAGLVALEGTSLVPVPMDADLYSMAYDVIANATLWPLHHHLFDLARRPVLDHRWRQAWDAYREYNTVLAEAVSGVAARDAAVLVHDYHLSLMPGILGRSRPDLSVVHFTHTPFADPGVFRVMPEGPSGELLGSLSAARACGFHSERWRASFEACCRDAGVRPSRTFVSPLAPHEPELADRVTSEACRKAGDVLDEVVGGRRMVLRVDRVEPSKNLLRGFWAYEAMLASRPEWRERVTMVAMAYLSRQNLPEYLAYRSEVEQAAERVNAAWGTTDWSPVLLDLADDPDRSLAALERYDVLLVNPVRDGLNLVAKEGPLVNRKDGALVLSREAGAFDELGSVAIGIDPFDTEGTAEALAAALEMGPDERARRARQLRALAGASKPERWLKDQIEAARS